MFPTKRGSCGEARQLPDPRVLYTILADERERACGAVQREVERLPEGMHVPRAPDVPRVEVPEQPPRKLRHFLRDGPVDGGEQMQDGGEPRVAGEGDEGNAPGDAASGREVRPGREAGGVAGGGEAEPEGPERGGAPGGWW